MEGGGGMTEESGGGLLERGERRGERKGEEMPNVFLFF